MDVLLLFTLASCVHEGTDDCGSFHLYVIVTIVNDVVNCCFHQPGVESSIGSLERHLWHRNRVDFEPTFGRILTSPSRHSMTRYCLSTGGCR